MNLFKSSKVEVTLFHWTLLNLDNLELTICCSFLPQFKHTLTSMHESLCKIREMQSQLITECQKSIAGTNADSPSNLIEMFLLQMSKGPSDIYNVDQLHHLLFDL